VETVSFAHSAISMQEDARLSVAFLQGAAETESFEAVVNGSLLIVRV
jgi:hypothetical protein